jgi:quercetin dioxygenase-like cupin family protein
MRNLVALGIASLMFCRVAGAEDAAPAASEHVALAATEVKWGAPPPVFEKGASFAVLSGDPTKAGPYVVRLQMPSGYKIAPHWHPTDENVTVVSGSVGFGMGDKIDNGAMKTLGAGGYTLMPASMHHYAVAQTSSVVQVHGTGPFALTYVNPADDPSTRPATK